MPSPTLQVVCGDSLQLQFVADQDAARPRLTVSVIGQIPGRSLLVTHPSVAGRLLLVRDGEPVACRMFSEGRMLGFKTTVRKVATHPDAYLHLDYPKELEQRILRSAPRVAVDLAGRIRMKDTDRSHAAHIEDVSLSGCRLTALRAAIDIGEAVVITADIKIDDSTQVLEIGGIVRNHLENADAAAHPEAQTYGIEFNAPSAEASTLLRAFLYDQLHASTRMPVAPTPARPAANVVARTRIQASA